VPEGHRIHRTAREFKQLFGGQRLCVSSPQGRFASGAALLDGKPLQATEAHGKHLFLEFEDEHWLHVHLGIYGGWTVGSPPPPAPRGAVRLRLVADTAYADLRGPSACEVVAPAQKAAIFARLGPDPLRRDADPDRAWHRLSRSGVAFGALLMQQDVVSGIGNVYRAEVLYRAGVSPFRAGRAVLRPVWDGIWNDLRALMRAGVRSGTIITTMPADRDRPRGRVRGDDAFYVYRRAGLPCRRCGTEVQRDVMAARNLFWCPVCQPN
jgi:formamidopyrimidine-DNA glycosylase